MTSEKIDGLGAGKIWKSLDVKVCGGAYTSGSDRHQQAVNAVEEIAGQLYPQHITGYSIEKWVTDFDSSDHCDKSRMEFLRAWNDYRYEEGLDSKGCWILVNPCGHSKATSIYQAWGDNHNAREPGVGAVVRTDHARARVFKSVVAHEVLHTFIDRFCEYFRDMVKDDDGNVITDDTGAASHHPLGEKLTCTVEIDGDEYEEDALSPMVSPYPELAGEGTCDNPASIFEYVNGDTCLSECEKKAIEVSAEHYNTREIDYLETSPTEYRENSVGNGSGVQIKKSTGIRMHDKGLDSPDREYESSLSLKIVNKKSEDSSYISQPGDGLPRYPKKPPEKDYDNYRDSINCYGFSMRAENFADLYFLYGWQNYTGIGAGGEGHVFQFSPKDNYIGLHRYTDSGFFTLDEDKQSYIFEDRWYYFVFTWKENEGMYFETFESPSVNEPLSKVWNLDQIDFNDGGVGWAVEGPSTATGYFDDFREVRYLKETEEEAADRLDRY